MYPNLAKDQCSTLGSSQHKTMDLPTLWMSCTNIVTPWFALDRHNVQITSIE